MKPFLLFGPITLCLAISAPSAAADERPNILLIMTDDQGWGDITSHGNPAIDTPTMDRVATEGVRFDRFFVCPLCAPTRASLLSGRYHLRTGTVSVTRGLETMRGDEVTVAEVLRDAGYATGCFGKWHNGEHYPNHPNGQGFDEFFGFCGGLTSLYFDERLERNGEPVETKGYISDVLTDAAIDFIGRHRGEPFFCYLPYNAPHTPMEVPDRYFDKYRARGLAASLAAIYGMVESLDNNLARLLDALDEMKLAENTVVFFLTDNGPNTDRYNGGMRGRKSSVHEGGVRVPLFVRWPGHIRPGSEVTQIAAHIDLLPTIAELAGAEVHATPKIDGVSLVPLLLGKATDWPDRMIFTHRSRGETVALAPGSVRTQRWRLANDGRDGQSWALFDMQADPGETHDLSAHYPEVAGKLQTAYETWFADATRITPERPAIPVGYVEAPRVALAAIEAYFDGDIRWYNGAGYTWDWITDWDRADETIHWELDVVRGGTYTVTLQYAQAAVGTTVEVEAAGQSVRGSIREPHDVPPRLRPDRDPDASRYIQQFVPHELGTLELAKGRTQLSLRALSDPGRNVMDLFSVELRRVREH